jgi:hypothetical protein
MGRRIGKYFRTGILSLGLLLAARFPALAKNWGTVTFMEDLVLNGKRLPAGNYSVEWKTHSPEATVEFVQPFKIVLIAEGRVERRHKKYRLGAVVYELQPDGSKSLIEIRFADSNKVLVFNHEPHELSARRTRAN